MLPSGEQDHPAAVAGHELRAARDGRRRNASAARVQPAGERREPRGRERAGRARVLHAVRHRGNGHGKRRGQHRGGAGERPAAHDEHRAGTEHRGDRGIDLLEVARPQGALGRCQHDAGGQPCDQAAPPRRSRAVEPHAQQRHERRREQRPGELDPDARAQPVLCREKPQRAWRRRDARERGGVACDGAAAARRPTPS